MRLLGPGCAASLRHRPEERLLRDISASHIGMYDWDIRSGICSAGHPIESRLVSLPSTAGFGESPNTADPSKVETRDVSSDEIG